MKQFRIRVLQSLLRMAQNHQSARRAISALLFAETLGISWYNPLWHLRNTSVFFARFWNTLRREMRGYRKPIAHPNPNALICEDFFCVRGSDADCSPQRFTQACYSDCFGISKHDSGVFVSSWNDYDGNPTWLDVGCRDCKHYLVSCKGIEPGAANPMRISSVDNPVVINARAT
jgi:hypothetical protein